MRVSFTIGVSNRSRNADAHTETRPQRPHQTRGLHKFQPNLLKAAATSHELAANDLLDAAEGGVRILESVWSHALRRKGPARNSKPPIMQRTHELHLGPTWEPISERGKLIVDATTGELHSRCFWWC